MSLSDAHPDAAGTPALAQQLRSTQQQLAEFDLFIDGSVINRNMSFWRSDPSGKWPAYNPACPPSAPPWHTWFGAYSEYGSINIMPMPDIARAHRCDDQERGGI